MHPLKAELLQMMSLWKRDN